MSSPSPAIITRIKAAKSKRGYVDLFVDEEFYGHVHIDTVTQHRLAKGVPLTEELDKLIRNTERSMLVRKAAFAFVSYKPRTVAQVRRKLLDKEYTEEEVNLALRFLHDMDLLNDELYASRFVRDMCQRSFPSPRKLRVDLGKRGIDPQIIDKAINQNYPHHAIDDFMRSALRKKLRTIQYKDYKKQRRLAHNHLIRLGFDSRAVRALIENSVGPPVESNE